jgi:exopolysaccharide biosynthesis polyprenyl glycosylphosphotransferase
MGMTIRVVPKTRGQRTGLRMQPWTTSPDVTTSTIHTNGRPHASASNGLKCAVVLLDAGAVVVVWTIVLLFLVKGVPWASAAAIVASTMVFSVLCSRLQRLYRARACVVRSEEKARLLRVVGADAVVVLVLANVLEVDLPLSAVAWASLFLFLVVVAFRSGFRQWLTMHRAAGRFLRPIVIAGDNQEAHHLVTLLVEQPELGFEVLGYFGRPPSEAPVGATGVPWLGPVDAVVEISTRLGATGLVVGVTAYTSQVITALTRAALDAGLHVDLSTGLHGVEHTRLRVRPLSYEPLLSVETVGQSRTARAAKRSIDVVLASVALVVALPVFAIAALAIKLCDRGPVFFRQQRIGRDGVPFDFYKLRTMMPGADARLGEVLDRNERIDSPLFKDQRDPRRTKVGRVLEATSIDELPQLWNVLRGDMSLVGPRPALPHEVEQFDEEFRVRHAVRPGITGLWQVEGRDNPNFGPYRRLDLIYVENYSLSLDAAILSMTAQIVLARAAGKLLRRVRRTRHQAVEITGPPAPLLHMGQEAGCEHDPQDAVAP